MQRSSFQADYCGFVDLWTRTSGFCWLLCRPWRGWAEITAVTSPLQEVSEGSAQQSLLCPKASHHQVFHHSTLLPFLFDVHMKLLRDRTSPFEPVISSKHTQHLPLFIVLFHLEQMVKLTHLPALEEFADRGRQTALNSTFTTYLFLRKILVSGRKKKVKLGFESGKSQL